MSLYLAAQGYYRSSLLDSLPWLDHCFGTSLAGPPAGARTLRQVHSARVLPAGACGPHEEGDGLLTATPGEWIAVKTADCVPILLADPRRRAAAAVHAGWRGVLAGAFPAAILAMEGEFGSRPGDLLAAFGPAIQVCCFEVGLEVAVQFQRIFPELDESSGKVRIDLAQALLQQAIAAGLPGEHISTGAPCTVCGPDHLYSWRRGRDAERRMYSGLAVRG